MTRGDLKGRKADLKGSEKEGSDLEKKEAETLKKQTPEAPKNLPPKVEGTEALGGQVPTQMRKTDQEQVETG